MFSARRLVGLSVLMVALIACGGAPAVTKDPATAERSPRAKDRAATKPSRTTTPSGELVQIGSVTYADWGHRDARDGRIRALEAGDFYFAGTFIQGEPRQVLTMELKNVADQVHNFSLPAQGLDRDIPPKGHPPMNVSVTFPASGELQFLCKYHTAQGMNGMLLLSDAAPQSVAEPSPGPSPELAR